MTTIQEAIAMGSRPINAHVERFEPAQCWYVRVGYHDGRETFGRTYRQKSNAIKECRRIHAMLDRLAVERVFGVTAEVAQAALDGTRDGQAG